MASRSRSRSPIKQSESFAESGRASPALSGTSGNESIYKKYQLIMNSVPLGWTFQQVFSYIRKHANPVDKSITENTGYISLTVNPNYPDSQQATITFKNERSRQQAFDVLKSSSEQIDGRKLYVKKHDVRSKNFALTKPKTLQNLRKPNRPFRLVNQHILEYDGEENDTFGLSVGYLEDLGIKTRPLTRWVFVRGLPEAYNDETKVREVFGKAGSIMSAAVLQSKSGQSYSARIEYDHPVEAVQAVSMFHNREVLGCKINCEMDFLKKKEFIDGVAQGPGLGPDGKPMRGIRIAVELKKATSSFMQEISKINESLDELKAQVTSLYIEFENAKAEKQTALNIQNTSSQIVSNPLAALGTIMTNQLQPMILQSLMQNTLNDVNPLGSLLKNLSGGNINLNNLLQQSQSGANTQSGLNFQSGPDNMQGGLNNMQSGPNNPQSGPSNLQSGPNNMQSDPKNMQAGPSNMQHGSNNMQGGSSYMQSGPQNQGKQNSFSQSNNTGFNTPNQQNHGGFNTSNQPDHYGDWQSSFGPNNKINPTKQKVMKCFKCGGTGHKVIACPASAITNNRKNLQTIERKPGRVLCDICFKFHSGSECWNKPKQGPNQNNNQQMTGGMGHSAMLLFKNLPPAVTYQVLQGKMLEVGEVKLVEMTGPGRALVSFSYEQDADKCMRLFNESTVDGQTIIVQRV